ncbi:MAG: thioredoxin domain-containing protein [Dactylosporangium sp.]|nr:thioredoxin domain-containing protein [Dactylosporangium sp.]NNJ59742.1 thioredoxin domain-containing protein [Dactylosporangium sp.]
MPNRLATATSPYLLQHAGNPVDWWPWCAEAFDEARARDVPVLISIGYAACHWCHVMAHESFENETIASLINELVVPIKVDREERPDIDAVYLDATRLMSGQGGWPMTVFATAEGQPFSCGTYLAPQVLSRLLVAVGDAWRYQRQAVVEQGGILVDALARVSPGRWARRGGGAGWRERAEPGGAAGPGTGLGPDERAMGTGVLEAAAASLDVDYDERYGGFGSAPKFPPHLSLLFLLRHHQRTDDARALEIADQTCAAMAQGGMYDLLGGGFARYSVDRHWSVPHFEKMLYDNALLLRVYTALARLTGDRLAARVAGETAGFLTTTLLTAEGGFASALDADTDGEEGMTYVWTPAELCDVLGEDDGAWAAGLLGVTATGTFERGTSVLRLQREPEDLRRYARVRAALLASRQGRAQPARDDKVVAAWNGLTVTALVEYAMTTAAVSPDRTGGTDGTMTTAARAGALAVEAGELLARLHLVDGRLRRVSLGGVIGAPVGVLDDYGAVAEAFCALHQYTGEGRWLRLAGELLDVGLARFADGDGGFFDTADDAERLVARPADPTDNPTPSGTSAMAAALLAHAALSGRSSYREAAERALSTIAPLAERHGRFTGHACAVGEALLSGPVAVAVASPDGYDDPLVDTAWRHLPPGGVVVAGKPEAPGVPLLSGRPLRDGLAVAYPCQGLTCVAPVTTPAELERVLEAAGGRRR